MSTFHGEIEEIPGISVDNFEKCESRAYFLSHCHFDHTYGLYENSFLTYLIKKRYYVYTSIHTARIIAHRKPALKNHLKPLKLGLEIVYIPGDAERAIDEKYVTVTLIPAGHCFGSVMFLFRTKDVTVLFTGDFRITEDDLHKYKDLHTEDGSVIHINKLYVDTEFQSPEYSEFPKRSESVEYAVIEIKKWLRKSERRRVALHVSAEYGYEYIFNVIYRDLGLKVYVNEVAWELYSQVPKLVPGVTNDPNSRIHLCSNKHETDSHEKCMHFERDDPGTSKTLHDNHTATENLSKTEQSAENLSKTDHSAENLSKIAHSAENLSKTDHSAEKLSKTDHSAEKLSKIDHSAENLSKTDHSAELLSRTDRSADKLSKPDKKAYLYMHFSARKWKNYVEGNKMYNTDYRNNRTDVCFATHCSRDELVYFVNYLSPENIVGFRDPYIGPFNPKISY